MAATIVEEGLVDDEFVADRVDGLRRASGSFVPAPLRSRSPTDAASTPADIRAAARLYADGRPSMAFHGLGVTEHIQGTDGVMCLVNLALLTGNLGRPGSGVNPLRGQNNVQGSAHMGCEPAHLTGLRPTGRRSRRASSAVWGGTDPDTRRPRCHGDARRRRQPERCKRSGSSAGTSLQTQPNTNATAEPLANLDVLIVQDLFLNETARAYATVFLPGVHRRSRRTARS